MFSHLSLCRLTVASLTNISSLSLGSTVRATSENQCILLKAKTQRTIFQMPLGDFGIPDSPLVTLQTGTSTLTLIVFHVALHVISAKEITMSQAIILISTLHEGISPHFPGICTERISPFYCQASWMRRLQKRSTWELEWETMTIGVPWAFRVSSTFKVVALGEARRAKHLGPKEVV